MGAVTALTLAALHPKRVTAVVALGLPPDGLPFGDTPLVDLDAEEEWARGFERDGMRSVVKALTSEGRPVWARLLGAADPGAMAARIRGTVAAARLAEHLRDIRQPLLLVWAEEEVPVPSLPLPPHARVVVLPGLDHVGVMEHPDLVVPELLAFLSAEDEGPGPANGHG
jgi:pimeloyl-ACP methyl ester carboxylesterase